MWEGGGGGGVGEFFKKKSLLLEYLVSRLQILQANKTLQDLSKKKNFFWGVLIVCKRGKWRCRSVYVVVDISGFTLKSPFRVYPNAKNYTF